MSYVVLARKYRPQTFDELVGQEFVSTALKNAIRMARISHAYLFTGARGVGKTSAARIMAKALNCLNPVDTNPCNECDHCREITEGTSMDVLEIDGASNRGVDEIRQLREAVKFIPIKYKYKVYIVDEIHMLTTEAANALLKTLEEPPSYVVFIFATTDVHKMLPTILSRCQRYDFKKIPFDPMKDALTKIYTAEGLEFEANALNLVIRQSEGCMRDSLSFSDQIIAYTNGKVTYDAVATMMGVNEDSVIGELFYAILNEDKKVLDALISNLTDKGISLLYSAEKMITHTRNLLLLKNGAPQLKKELTSEEMDFYNTIAKTSEARLFAIFQLLQKLHSELKYSSFARYSFEFGMYKAASLSNVIPLPADTIQNNTQEKKTEQISTEPLEPQSQKAESKAIKSQTSEPKKVESSESKKVEQVDISSAGEMSLTDVENKWHFILNTLKESEAGLAASLFHSQLKISGNLFKIYFDKEREFNYKRASSPSNKTKLESFLASKMGKEIKVEFFFNNPLVNPKLETSLSGKKDKLDSVFEQKMRDEFVKNPIIEKLLKETGVMGKDLEISRIEK